MVVKARITQKASERAMPARDDEMDICKDFHLFSLSISITRPAGAECVNITLFNSFVNSALVNSRTSQNSESMGVPRYRHLLCVFEITSTSRKAKYRAASLPSISNIAYIQFSPPVRSA